MLGRAAPATGGIRTDHRPWPPPAEPWSVAMTWHDLLFAHWPVPIRELRPLVPAGLAVDAFDGEAWVGVVPFHMTGVRPRWLPEIPGISAFPELNVRTYVVVDDKPGVYFFSLDAGSLSAALMARAWFRLPYFHARMSSEWVGGGVRYASRRLARPRPAELVVRYRPIGDPFRSGAGSLAHWLTERYCLYTADRRGRLCRADILHEPWLLCQAEAEIRRNSMASARGIALPDIAPVLHFAAHQEVVAWTLERVGSL